MRRTVSLYRSLRGARARARRREHRRGTARVGGSGGGGLRRRPAAGARHRRHGRLADHVPLPGRRPAGRDQARPDPGHRRRPRRRGARAHAAAPHPAPRRGRRRGVRPHGPRRPAVGDRPDRRHEELRPRRAGVGDAHRAARRGPARSSAWSRRPRSGGAGGRRPAPARGPAAAWPRPAGCTSRRSPTCADASLSYSDLAEWERAGRLEAFLDLQRPVLAQPRLRRLLVVHAGGRGRRRRGGRARPGALRHGGAGTRRRRGGRQVHLARRRRRHVRSD